MTPGYNKRSDALVHIAVNLRLTLVALFGLASRSVAAALALALVWACSSAAEPGYSFDATPGRLPKTVVPVHYAIDLEPNLQSLTLAGSEIVDIDVREPTPGV